jgi:hypothetical protein
MPVGVVAQRRPNGLGDAREEEKRERGLKFMVVKFLES